MPVRPSSRRARALSFPPGDPVREAARDWPAADNSDADLRLLAGRACDTLRSRDGRNQLALPPERGFPHYRVPADSDAATSTREAQRAADRWPGDGLRKADPPA